MDDELDSLFAIDLTTSEDETTATTTDSKVPRDFQSEEDFQRQRREWKPKIEGVGQLYKKLELPINNPSKPESQMVLHAVEELYFERRYGDAKGLLEEILKGELGDEFRRVLEGYLERCKGKLGKVES